MWKAWAFGDGSREKHIKLDDKLPHWILNLLSRWHQKRNTVSLWELQVCQATTKHKIQTGWDLNSHCCICWTSFLITVCLGLKSDGCTLETRFCVRTVFDLQPQYGWIDLRECSWEAVKWWTASFFIIFYIWREQIGGKLLWVRSV